MARNGKLVAEHYFNGHGPDSLQDMRSAGKSVTSTLVGIAIANGALSGVDARSCHSFLPTAPLISVRHLLTLTSGLDANADDTSSPGYEERMWETEEWVRFVLDLPMAPYASPNSFPAVLSFCSHTPDGLNHRVTA